MSEDRITLDHDADDGGCWITDQEEQGSIFVPDADCARIALALLGDRDALVERVAHALQDHNRAYQREIARGEGRGWIAEDSTAFSGYRATARIIAHALFGAAIGGGGEGEQ